MEREAKPSILAPKPKPKSGERVRECGEKRSSKGSKRGFRREKGKETLFNSNLPLSCGQSLGTSGVRDAGGGRTELRFDDLSLPEGLDGNKARITNPARVRLPVAQPNLTIDTSRWRPH